MAVMRVHDGLGNWSNLRVEVHVMRQDPILRFLDGLVDGIKARETYVRFSPYMVDGTIIGNGSQDFTKTYTTYVLSLKGVNAQLIDCPGIEGDEAKFKGIIEDALKKCHLVCYVARESKGIETGTLEKIKSYLGANVEVVGVQNVPFNPRKEYDGEDYFSDAKREIVRAIRKRGNIEESLKTVIPPDLYANMISVSALPGLCAIAQRDGESTFADPLSFAEDSVLRDSLETLRRQQRNFLRHATKQELFELSRLDELSKAIENSCSNAPLRIKRNALQRLLEKLRVIVLDPLETISKKLKRTCQSVEKRVDAYIRNLDNARFQMVRNIEHAVQDSIYDFYREEVLEKIIYPHIEQNVGIEKDELNVEIAARSDQLSVDLKAAMVAALKTSQDESLDRISQYTKEFQHGMELDFAKLNVDFPVLSGDSFGLSDFGGWALSIGGYALSGAAIGSMIPGLGNIAGAVVGALVGFALKLWEWASTWGKSAKINKAKSKARDAIDRVADDTWQKVSDSITQYTSDLSSKIGDIMDKAEQKKTAAKTTQETIMSCVKKLRSLVRRLEKQIASLEEQYA